MKPIQGLVFDFDNTIAKNVEPTDFLILDIINRYSPITDEQYLLKIIQESTTDYQICQKLVPEENIEDVYNEILKLNIKNAEKVLYFPEVVELILYLKNHYALYIISGRDILSLTHSLKKYKIDNCFCEIIGGDSGFEAKPSPEALKYIITKYKFVPSQIAYVGDSKTDYLMAKKANCHFVRACWYDKDYTEDNIISCHDIGSFLQIVKSIQSN